MIQNGTPASAVRTCLILRTTQASRIRSSAEDAAAKLLKNKRRLNRYKLRKLLSRNRWSLSRKT